MNRLEQRCKVTVSIGVAGLRPEMSTEDLIKEADEAHYRAKQAGKNRVVGPESSPRARRPLNPPGNFNLAPGKTVHSRLRADSSHANSLRQT